MIGSSHSKAIKVWETAWQYPSHQVRLPQDLAQAYAGRGTCLSELGRYAESLPAFDRSLALAQDPFATQGRQMALFELRQASVPALRLTWEITPGLRTQGGLFKDRERQKVLHQDSDQDALRGHPDFIRLLREAAGEMR